MLRESHRPGIEPATCKSQVQRLIPLSHHATQGRWFAGAMDVLPRFVVEPRSQVVKPGSPAILTCAVEHDVAIVQWTFNGRTLTDAVHRRGRRRDDEPDGQRRGEVVVRRRGLSTRQTDNDHSLQVGAFDASRHEGVYQCLATTSAGSLLSRPATLEPAGRISLLAAAPELLTGGRGSNQREKMNHNTQCTISAANHFIHGQI